MRSHITIMASEISSRVPCGADRPQFRLRSLFGAMFWTSLLLASTVRAPWQIIPAIVLIWLAALILYQAVLGRMDCERATIAILAALGSAVPFGLIGLIAADITKTHPVKSIPFDATAWQGADPIEDHRTVRSQMIDDLLKRYSFRGWSESEVIELLGTPDRGPPSTPRCWLVYRLGAERGAWALDDEYLYFQFNAQNRVTDFGTTVD